jgi:hypothetical protein
LPALRSAARRRAIPITPFSEIKNQKSKILYDSYHTRLRSVPSTVPPAAPRAVRSFEEFDAALTELDRLWSGVKPLLATVKSLEEQSTRITQSLAEVRRSVINRGPTAPRLPGQVTDECARAVAAAFIAHCENSNRLNVLCSIPAQRQALSAFAHDTLGVTTRTALSTADIPLPSQYGREIRELISDFGVVRRRMLPYPIGMGASRPARMGEHGTPRMDTSDQVWFMNDQLAIRFIEEIDFDYAADDATAVLLTPAVVPG